VQQLSKQDSSTSPARRAKVLDQVIAGEFPLA